MRNALAHVGTKQRAMVAAAIRTAFTQETREAAHKEWRAVADRLRERFPKLGALMDEAEDNVLSLGIFAGRSTYADELILTQRGREVEGAGSVPPQ